MGYSRGRVAQIYGRVSEAEWYIIVVKSPILVDHSLVW